MKTDLYTKIVLTIIAVALTINVVKSFVITPAQAAPLNAKRTVTLPVNADGTIDVNIKAVNSSSYALSSGAIPVVIKER